MLWKKFKTHLVAMAKINRPTTEFDENPCLESFESLALDFGPAETVHHWEKLLECDEFVGSRFVISLPFIVRYDLPVGIMRTQRMLLLASLVTFPLYRRYEFGRS